MLAVIVFSPQPFLWSGATRARTLQDLFVKRETSYILRQKLRFNHMIFHALRPIKTARRGLKENAGWLGLKRADPTEAEVHG